MYKATFLIDAVYKKNVTTYTIFCSEHAWTRISNEVDTTLDMEQLELVNSDDGDLVSHLTIDEAN